MIYLIDDIWFIILDFIFPCPKRLKSFIDPSKLDWKMLASNPNAPDYIMSHLDAAYLKFLEMDFQMASKYATINFYCKTRTDNHLDYSILRNLITKNEEIINWDVLSANPGAMHILKRYPLHIVWKGLSSNPIGIEMLMKNYDKINWENLARNPGVSVSLITKNLYRLNENLTGYNPPSFGFTWSSLSSNPSMIELLEANISKIDWSYLSKNPGAIHLLETSLLKINWAYLSQNPAAIEILERSSDKINWVELSANPAAIELIEKNIEKISWSGLSKNPAAIEILERNIDQIDWVQISSNSEIFEDDLGRFRNRKKRWLKEHKIEF